MNLKMNTRSIDDRASLIDLEEIDVYTASEAADHNLLDSGVRHIFINLTNVEYLDSTALGVLIGGLKRLRERDGSRT